MSAVIDVPGLFRKFTVAEVKDIEKKVKGDIEKKKEDLRQMVGRRYRDIIEAADSIRDMKLSAENIAGSVRDVQSGFERLQTLQQRLIQAQQRATLVSSSQVPLDPDFVNDTLLKLFLDLPELVWRSLDTGKFLPAVWFLLLAENVHHGLSIKFEDGSSRKQLLNAHWPSIRTLRIRILSNWRANATEDISESELCDAMCARLLLENLTISELVQKYLGTVKEDVSMIFEGTEQSSREQVGACLESMQAALSAVHRLFVARRSDDASLVAARLRQLMTGKWTPENFTKYLCQKSQMFTTALPYDVKIFRPVVSQEPKDLTSESLQSIAEEWLRECLTVSEKNIKALMGYIESLEMLCALKSSIHERLQARQEMVNWDEICGAVLGSPVDFWELLIRDLLENRLMDLAKLELKRCFAEFENSVLETDAQAIEVVEMRKYLWKELMSDVPSLSDDARVSTLTLKARGIRSTVYHRCHELELELKRVRGCLDRYLDRTDPKVRLLSMSSSRAPQADHLFQALSDSCASVVEKFAEQLKVKLDQKNDLWSSDEMNRAVYWSEVCLGLCELCPSLRLILNWKSSGAEKDASSKNLRRSQEAEAWKAAKSALLSAATNSLNFWVEESVARAKEAAAFEKLKLGDDAWLLDAQEWESIGIQEETETGEKVESRLSVPMQCSRALHRFLHSLTNSLNAVGAHRLPKTVQMNLGKECFAELLTYLRDLAECHQTRIRQRHGIQLLFDFRVVSGLFKPKSGSETEQAGWNEVAANLESLVDPFDLDVISQHLKRNVTKQIQKLTALYGVLMPENAQSLAATKTTGTESAQLLPLVPNLPRFQLLPAGSFLDLTFQLQDGSKPLADSLPPSVSRKTEDAKSVAKSSSAASFSAFYDKISSSWFG